MDGSTARASWGGTQTRGVGNPHPLGTLGFKIYQRARDDASLTFRLGLGFRLGLDLDLDLRRGLSFNFSCRRDFGLRCWFFSIAAGWTSALSGGAGQ